MCVCCCAQGLLVTLAIGLHNVPEGLAVATVLVAQGISPWHALWWTLATSLPQPLLALPSFLFVDAFSAMLPLALGFAAGCMVWIVFAELLPDALADAPHAQVGEALLMIMHMMHVLLHALILHGTAPAGCVLSCTRACAGRWPPQRPCLRRPWRACAWCCTCWSSTRTSGCRCGMPRCGVPSARSCCAWGQGCSQVALCPPGLVHAVVIRIY
jgi:hypothetical protein